MDLAVSVWKGEPGPFIQVACNGDFDTGTTLPTPAPNTPFPLQADLTTDLIGGQTYYIMLSTQGNIPGTPQIINFSVRQGILGTLKIENTAPNLAYSGMWTTVTNVGQSGSVAETTDDYATASFSMQHKHNHRAYDRTSES